MLILCFPFQPILAKKKNPGHLSGQPHVRLIPSKKFTVRFVVDCKMATVWIGDSFRIFPGKYGEDPLWGDSHELKYASGSTVDEVFNKKPEDFKALDLPSNASPLMKGLHGAVWFETLYQDPKDPSQKTLYALYHNENYPSTLLYDSVTGEGYPDDQWPEDLRGPETKTAVCRIGIMKSSDGGKSWADKGILGEARQPRLIPRPHNTGIILPEV